MKLFISYCNNDGLIFASSAANTLEAKGHRAWYFDRDKTPGILRIVDITRHIRRWCNIIIFICTNSSISSEGQLKEIGQWDMSGKQLIAISIDGPNIPEPIEPYIYESMSSIQFEKEFDIFVQNRLEEITNSYKKLNPLIKVKDTLGATLP